MTALLTDSDFAQIRSAIGDVCETFLQKEVTYKLFRDSMSRMNSDGNKNTTREDFTLKGLVVWSKTMPLETRQGITDLSDGYILFNLDALAAVENVNEVYVPPAEEGGGPTTEEVMPKTEEVITTLFSGGKLLMAEGQDRAVIDGEEMLVTMVLQLGQLKDQNVVVKVFIQRQAGAI